MSDYLRRYFEKLKSDPSLCYLVMVVQWVKLMAKEQLLNAVEKSVLLVVIALDN